MTHRAALRKVSIQKDLLYVSIKLSKNYLSAVSFIKETLGSVVVKALCYKPEGRGFETR
jgi:hypothetical protein